MREPGRNQVTQVGETSRVVGKFTRPDVPAHVPCPSSGATAQGGCQERLEDSDYVATEDPASSKVFITFARGPLAQSLAPACPTLAGDGLSEPDTAPFERLSQQRCPSPYEPRRSDRACP